MASESPPNFGSLQRELVVHILSKLDSIHDLHRAALVSRFFRSCTDSASLCRERDVCIRGGSAAGLLARRQRLASLIHWLHTHGRHLRSLRIKDQGVLLLEELQLLESCMLAVVQACTQLEQLAVQFESIAVDPGWARPLTALRRLALFSGTLLLPPSGLHGLQRCTQLALYGRQSALDKDTQLPPNVRELMLGMQQGGELPSQLGKLSALHTLELWGDWRGTTALCQLASLRHLYITGPGLVPRELGTLTGLESLLVGYDRKSAPPGEAEEENAHRLRAAVEQLTGLTSLAVSWPDGPCSFLPEHELHGLTRLRRCYFDRLGFETYNLPGGPWLASLRFLAANTWSLIDTVRVLEGATALTRLTLVDWPDNDIDSGPPGNAQIADFYEWAQAHPQLRRLTFVNSNSNAVDGKVFRGALALKAARPELQIDACPGGCDPALADFFYSGLDDLAPGWSTSIALTEPYQY